MFLFEIKIYKEVAAREKYRQTDKHAESRQTGRQIYLNSGYSK